MGKSITILEFFERKNTNISKVNTNNTLLPTFSVNIIFFNSQTIFRKIEIDASNISSLVFC